jgi:WD40 repeat protein
VRARCIALTPDAKVLAAATDCGTVHLWSVADGRDLRELATTGDAATLLRVSRNGRIALMLCEGGNVSMCDLLEGVFLSSWHEPRYERLCAALSEDGRMAVVGDSQGALHVYDVRTGKAVRAWEAHVTCVTGVSLSATCRVAVSAGFDHVVRVWNVTSGIRQRSLREEGSVTEDPGRFAWSPSMAWGARVIDDNSDPRGDVSNIVLIDRERSAVFRALRVARERVRSVAVSPGGRLVAFANGDGTAGVWDIATGHVRHILGANAGGHLGITEEVVFSPDGHCVLSGARDPILRLWDVATGDCINEYPGRDGVIWSLAMAPHGRWFVCAGGDAMDVPEWDVHLFDLRTGRVRHVLPGHSERVVDLVIAPDAESIYSGSHDQTVRVWHPTGGPLACYHTNAAVRVLSKRIDADLFLECIDVDGEHYRLTMRNVKMTAPIVTPAFLYCVDLPRGQKGAATVLGYRPGKLIPGHYQKQATIRCPWCREHSEAPPNVLSAIARLTAGLRARPPCMYLPDAAWDHPALRFSCLSCGAPLRSNPFIVDDRWCD